MQHFLVLPVTFLWMLVLLASDSSNARDNIQPKSKYGTASNAGEPTTSGHTSVKFIADAAIADYAAMPVKLTTPADQLQVIAANVDLVTSSRPSFNTFWLTIGTTTCGLTALFTLLWYRRKSALASNIAQLAASYEAMDIGILAIDIRGNTLATNSEFRRLTGISLKSGDSAANIGEQIAEHIRTPKDFQRTWLQWKNDFQASGQMDIEFDVPNVRHVKLKFTPIRAANGSPIGRLLILHDETDKRQIESQLLHSNRLEAVGRMVGGIAHDFNNVLMAISANLAVARTEQAARGSAVSRELVAAEEAAYRGADTVRQLLTFATKKGLDLEPHSVNSVIERLGSLTRHTFDASIKFAFDLDERDPIAMLEATALEQVLLNLFVNAKDAMPSGGRVTTSTRVTKNRATDEDVIMISVCDEGEGIPAEIANQIFDPFFTTKDQESGTGLGLSTSYRVIEQHGGSLAYKQRRRGGSEFQIILPLYQGISAKPIPSSEIARGEGTVLVVDDDDVVRAVAETILRRFGYDTISAADGHEALETLARNYEMKGEPGVDLVLLDLTMPGMPGREVMRQMQSSYPGTPIILCSGYLVASNYQTQEIDGPNAEIQKPYSVEELVTTVNCVVQQPARASAWPAP